VSTLRSEAAREPSREHLQALLMLALYRSGRQADALAVFRDARRHLVEELGLEATPALRDLQERILRQDPALAPRAQPAADLSTASAAPSTARSRRLRIGLGLALAAVAALAVGSLLDARGSGGQQVLARALRAPA